jgi:hypothetical protein
VKPKNHFLEKLRKLNFLIKSDPKKKENLKKIFFFEKKSFHKVQPKPIRHLERLFVDFVGLVVE